MEDEYPLQDRENTAVISMIIEIIFGLTGALGMGWLYVGDFGKAALISSAYLVFCLFEAFFIVVSIGIAAFCFAPVNILVIAVSSIKLREHVRNTGATGNFLYLIIAFIFVIALVVVVVAASILILTGRFYFNH